MQTTLTRRAFFFNLFIMENCFNLDLTMSPKGTFGAFFAFCIQGWSTKQKKGNKDSQVEQREHERSQDLSSHLPRTCWAVKRLVGSGFSICFTRLFALSDIWDHGSLLKSRTPLKIASATPCSVSAKSKPRINQHRYKTCYQEPNLLCLYPPAQKGGTPQSKM